LTGGKPGCFEGSRTGRHPFPVPPAQEAVCRLSASRRPWVLRQSARGPPPPPPPPRRSLPSGPAGEGAGSAGASLPRSSSSRRGPGRLLWLAPHARSAKRGRKASTSTSPPADRPPNSNPLRNVCSRILARRRAGATHTCVVRTSPAFGGRPGAAADDEPSRWRAGRLCPCPGRASRLRLELVGAARGLLRSRPSILLARRWPPGHLKTNRPGPPVGRGARMALPELSPTGVFPPSPASPAFPPCSALDARAGAWSFRPLPRPDVPPWQGLGARPRGADSPEGGDFFCKVFLRGGGEMASICVGLCALGALAAREADVASLPPCSAGQLTGSGDGAGRGSAPAFRLPRLEPLRAPGRAVGPPSFAAGVPSPPSPCPPGCHSGPCPRRGALKLLSSCAHPNPAPELPSLVAPHNGPLPQPWGRQAAPERAIQNFGLQADSVVRRAEASALQF